ncbi:MAG: hypothetical protein HUJ13_10695 [Hydrogenovibrio crunogenus]|uniref:Uncharacterized protein n=1 Tax=Hydrogenovibrio crunogenus (strain DSM 25203 / XCL-2) TaxID=317025 RepID=Q31G61_HYDCU|nr:hypothetical protein [Hydrogenovibrio crunogenus]
MSTAWAVNNMMSHQFKVGDTVLVGFPSTNIKDDAYIIGIVQKITPKGNYQISVRDFVEGHDYGLSCVPIAVDSAGNETGQSGWEMWDNTKQLTSDGLQYIVPADNVVKLAKGQMNFIDRYNVYITYSRWKSNVPVMSIDRLESAEAEARYANISEMIPAFEIAKLDRASYFDSTNGRPYWPYESVPHLTKLMDHIIALLKNKPEINQLWRAEKRDWAKINQSMETYFLIDALDKAVDDAYFLLNEESIDKADTKALKRLKEQLKYLGKIK